MDSRREMPIPAGASPTSILPDARRAELAPAERLQLAVLEDALRVWCSLAGVRSRGAARMRTELVEWFGSETADGPFTFASICDALGIERDAMRSALGFRARRAA